MKYYTGKGAGGEMVTRQNPRRDSYGQPERAREREGKCEKVRPRENPRETSTLRGRGKRERVQG